ncbi:hypothetical protein [Aquibacillus albus]|uniref:Uncharacterized protein n=1 Tax=Aquibacillus albus TaxID=1168171 RepID=A0ABS2N682_9BACI|nr:hypothetical protein [Aquibacillus albus]MBM7573651.1 hypothetical protein [Aquibacillus albus]
MNHNKKTKVNDELLREFVRVFKEYESMMLKPKIEEKRKSKLGEFVFTVSKSGTGQATKKGLDLILYPVEELSKDEAKSFEATEGKNFDEELFEQVLQVPSEDQQIEDLTKFGFDVSRLGVESEKEKSQSRTRGRKRKR